MLFTGLDRIGEILLRSRTIVVVGCSRDPEKEAHEIPRYLLEHGYEVYCVNPNAGEIFGRKVFRDVSEAPRADILLVFRPPEEVEEIARSIPDDRLPDVFWMQDGIRNENARKLLEEKGVTVIEDRCIRNEHARVFQPKGETYLKILKAVRIYAKARGFVLNPDPTKLDAIVSALAQNEETRGHRYCPCRVVTGNWEEDKWKICPCKWHLEEIERDGHCKCRLFWDPKALKD